MARGKTAVEPPTAKRCHAVESGLAADGRMPARGTGLPKERFLQMNKSTLQRLHQALLELSVFSVELSTKIRRYHAQKIKKRGTTQAVIVAIDAIPDYAAPVAIETHFPPKELYLSNWMDQVRLETRIRLAKKELLRYRRESMGYRANGQLFRCVPEWRPFPQDFKSIIADIEVLLQGSDADAPSPEPYCFWGATFGVLYEQIWAWNNDCREAIEGDDVDFRFSENLARRESAVLLVDNVGLTPCFVLWLEFDGHIATASRLEALHRTLHDYAHQIDGLVRMLGPRAAKPSGDAAIFEAVWRDIDDPATAQVNMTLQQWERAVLLKMSNRQRLAVLRSWIHKNARDTANLCKVIGEFYGIRLPDTEDYPRHSQLTTTEEMILEALGSQVLQARQLLRIAGYDNSSHYRAILSNLCKRGILVNSREGYRLVRQGQ